MYTSNNGCTAIRLEDGSMILLVPGKPPQVFSKKAAADKYFSVTDDEDAPEQECVNYVMGNPEEFKPLKQITKGERKRPSLLEGERFTITIYGNGGLLVSPKNPFDWVDVVQARDTEKAITRLYKATSWKDIDTAKIQDKLEDGLTSEFNLTEKVVSE